MKRNLTEQQWDPGEGPHYQNPEEQTFEDPEKSILNSSRLLIEAIEENCITFQDEIKGIIETRKDDLLEKG